MSDRRALQDVIRQASAIRPPSTSGMVASLRLEAIGDNYRPLRDRFRQALHMIGSVPAEHRLRVLVPGGPWVARILGRSEKYGIEREFMRGRRDYRDANGPGSRGVYLYYLLPEGIYEVHELVSWKRDRRYFVRSEAGRIVEIEREEVEAHLDRKG